MCQEIVSSQKSLDAVPLGAVRFGDDGRRSPLGLEAGEVLFPFLNVDFHWNEIFADEFLNLFLRIDLGFQPSASGSHRRGAEIKQNHFISRLRRTKALVRIAVPSQDCHRSLLLVSKSG